MNEVVYIVTEAEMLEPERFIAVHKTFDGAEKTVYDAFPGAVKEPYGTGFRYLCREVFVEKLMYIKSVPLRK